jgi:hypothetical protein
VLLQIRSAHDQITLRIDGSCRSSKIKIDDVFERKDDIAIAVKRELN